MRVILSYKQSAILFIATIFSLVILPMTKATSLVTGNNNYFLMTPYQQRIANNESTHPFEFHSGFWINLHHFLYEQALLRKQAIGTAQAANNSVSPKSQLSSGQQKLWDAALDYYTNAMIKRDLTHDDDMIKINDQLGESESATDLSKSGLNNELIKILESVAPVYRARWWTQHDKANRFWIAVATPLVQQFSKTLINQLTAAFKAKWPSEPIRVDVVEYANWAGAYTTFDSANKVHITMSTDLNNQGFSALEMLFHESSHRLVGPFNGAVAQAIARECKAKNKPIPNGLWHAIIFYTTGELTKRNLKEYRVTEYTPYGYRGLYARAWPNLQRPLELYWQPYLEGTVDFDKAISNLIGSL